MPIDLALTSDFWQDEATLTLSGDGIEAVLALCIPALHAAGYEIQVRAADGDLVPYEDYDWSDREV